MLVGLEDAPLRRESVTNDHTDGTQTAILEQDLHILNQAELVTLHSDVLAGMLKELKH